MGLRLKIGVTIAATAAMAAAVTGAQVPRMLEDNARDAAAETLQFAQRVHEQNHGSFPGLQIDPPDLPRPLREELAPGKRATFLVEGDSPGSAELWAAAETHGKVFAIRKSYDRLLTDDLEEVMWQAGTVGTAVATLIGLGLATRLGWRLRVSARRAVQIADGDLAQRLPQGGTDEIARLNGAVNIMAEALAARLQAEREVTANIAHELRTPVAGMVTAAGLLPAGRTEDMVRERAGRVRDLMEDVLEVARLDGGAERAQWREAELGVLARRAVRAATADREADPARVAVRITSDAVVETDPRRVERVLTNLVTNALRHGAEPVVVEVAGGAGRVVVRDHGRGFPADLLTGGPQRFRTGAQGTGLGLGLTIAVGQTQVLGGRLEFTNAQDGGARAVLELPGAVREAAQDRGTG